MQPSEPGSLGAVRRQWIVDRILQRGALSATDAAIELGVSVDSIRRDLRLLHDEGVVRRVHGGAVAVNGSPSGSPSPSRPPADVAALAGRVLASLPPGGVVILDAGTTSEAVAQGLPAHAVSTVITTSPVVAAVLLGRTDLRLVLVGGLVDPIWGAATGTQAVEQLRSISADVAVLGVCGIHPQRGATTASYSELPNKQAMVETATRVIVAAAPDKIGHVGAYRICPTKFVHTLVVESGTSATIRKSFQRAGCEVLTA